MREVTWKFWKKEVEIIYKAISGNSFKDIGVNINSKDVTSSEELLPSKQNQPETKQASILQDTLAPIVELKSIDLKPGPTKSDSTIELNLEENSIQKTEVFTEVDFRHEGKNSRKSN